ncbi:HlyD family efflux transporter periplasmic adaptor subunit [Paludibacterium paludis]|uniref:Multidrug resistance protein n=1 Tax=Paludibacterium paludis TaxID=1225769 RepID=A0A918P5W5_9NEIS|nr:HlyD family efflux transporter periplasmic adaptor subunit [Paludibacterium paludis]GGY23399.1 multidrug resistance protein [Paludibacterium paludis]
MNSTPATTPPPVPSGRPRLRLPGLLAGASLAVAAVAWGAWYGLSGRWRVSTDNAYVQGNIVQITPQTRGTVVAVGADNGDFVRAGDVLLRFDPSESRLALAAAEANLASVVRKVRGLYSDAGSARAEMAARQVAVDKASADFERRKGLAASGAIPVEELAHARDDLRLARTERDAVRKRFQTRQSLVDDTMLVSHPDVIVAQSALRAAFLEHARATVLAPVTGHIAKRGVQVGQRVQPGEPLMAVVPLREVWIEANFTETQLAGMRLGQPARIRVDMYGDEVSYDGKIQSLGIGTGSAFALLPAQNATGNWVKIAQRVPVRIALTRPEQLDAHPLRIGLSAHVDVDLRDRRGALLAHSPPGKPASETTVYRDQLAQADALIRRIVRAAAPAGDRTPEHS